MNDKNSKYFSTGAVRLEGDVITANGSILSGHLGHRIHIDPNPGYYPQLQQLEDSESLEGDKSSMCSCSCGCFRATRQRRWETFKFPWTLISKFEF